MGSYEALFFSTLTGATFLVILISLVYSGGKTINFIFLLIASFIFIERYLSKKNTGSTDPDFKNNQDQRTILNLKTIANLLALIAVIFLWQASVVLKIAEFPIDIIEKDSFFYAEISKCLINTGHENTFTASNLASQKYNFPTPYHYYDLWLNGFVCKIFGFNHSLGLYLITYSFFSGVLVFGFLSVTERFTKIKITQILIALLLLFVCSIYIAENVFHLYRFSGVMEGMMERYGGKLTAVYCFTLSVIILFVLNNNKKALIVALCLPLLFISLAPAVYFGILVFCIYNIFFKKNDRLFYGRLFLYCLMVMACIGLFYFITKKNDLNYRLDKPLMSYTDLYNFSFFRLKVFLIELFLKFRHQPFIFILNYLPFLLVLFYLWIKKKLEVQLRSLLLLFCLIWFAGSIAGNTLYLMDDAFQLYTNLLVLWHVLFGFLFIIFLYREKHQSIVKYLISVIFIFSLIFNAWNSWFSYEITDHYDPKLSQKYLLEVNTICDSFDKGIKGATFYDDTFYKNLLISYPLEYYCVPFILSQNIYVPYNLSATAEIPANNKYQFEKCVSKSPYNLYLSDHAIVKDTLQDKIDFIKLNNIKYLVCPKEQTTDFANYFKIKTEVKDEITGQRFIVLE